MGPIIYTKNFRKKNKGLFKGKTFFILLAIMQLQSVIVYYKYNLEASAAEIGQYIFESFGVFFNPILSLPWDDKKSFLFLADSGIEQGDRLLNGPFREDLDCDYLQLAHHGQQGVSKDFYRTIKFNACLWPTPSWVYNNDAGKGFNTHILKTVEIRNLIDSLGIKKNYISFEGLTRIE